MLISVVTHSRSSGIGNGLTYETDDPVSVGCLAEVPLRTRIVEGIVIATGLERKDADFDVKKVKRVLSPEPVLSVAQIKTMQWMAQYYFISLRQALKVFLPALPWHGFLPPEQTVYSLICPDCTVRGKKQMMVIEYLRQRGHACDEEIMADTGVSRTILRTLVKRKHLKIEKQRKTLTVEDTAPFNTDHPPPRLTAQQMQALKIIGQAKKPVLLLDRSDASIIPLYIHLLSQSLTEGKSAMLLAPDIYSALELYRSISQVIGERFTTLLHSQLTLTQRRDIRRKLQRSPQVIIGTRTALFSAPSVLSLILLHREHDEGYKNDQTPRYHARHVAEILALYSRATLVLSSRMPSVDSWHHASDAVKRFDRVTIKPDKPSKPHAAIHIIDLHDIQFGTAYPFSPVLLKAIDDRLKRAEQSVLLLNRRGAGTALLCLECRQTVVSPLSKLPMTVHTVSGKPLLIDHYSGLTQPVPARCPHCGSTRLFPVGAGTQRIESLLERFFPQAHIQRIDSSTLESSADLPRIRKRAERGEIDIIIGTQPVVRLLSLPKTTLAAAVIADVGLSLPDFRAGERVFQLLFELVGRSLYHAHIHDVFIQTFRPDAPEIRLSAAQNAEEYLTLELLLRHQSGYPPMNQLISLIIRSIDRPGMKAQSLLKQAQQHAGKHITVTAAPSMYDPKIWRVFLRGSNPRSILHKLDLTDVIVDIDPIDIL